MLKLTRLLSTIYLLSLVTALPAQEPDAVPNSEVVVSVTAKEVKPTESPKAGDTKISMSFDKADINSVVKFLSMTCGVPIVADPDLKGSVTIVSLKQIPLSDAFEVVNAALRVRGYTMVGNLDSKVVRVVPLKKAIADRSTVQAGKEPDSIVSTDNFVTQVIPLDYISAAKLKDELKPLVADDQASLVAVSSTNTLIVTDNAGNVRRIAEVVQALDKDTSDVIEVKIYKCRYASADSLVETLNKIFQIKPQQPQQPQQQRPDGGPPQQQVKTEEGLISLKGEIRITSDSRTNSLVISAAKERVELVMDVIEKLDINTEPEVQAKIFPLEYADAKLVAEQLNKLFEQPQGSTAAQRPRYPWEYYGPSGGQTGQATSYAGLKRNIIVADVRTNSVIVTATEQNMRAFETMIKQLDAPKVLSEVTRLFPLRFAKAPELADTLNRLFRGEYRRTGSFYDYYFSMMRTQDEEGPLSSLKNITVVAEDKTNTLLVTGPPQAFTMVESLITQLDRRTVQVFIEVAIVDVTLDNDTKFGVEWTWTSSATRPDGTPEQTATTDFGLAKETSGLKYSVISDNLKALLHALETRSNVRVYSTPTVTTADNVEALISIGRDEPFVTSEIETTGGNFRRTVDFKNVAVALTVTPHVNEASDLIAMDVHQTINEIIGREPELGAPIIANREARTSIMVRDGQTIVIGGIMKENRERVSRGVPIISRLPVIGNLFKTQQWRNQNSELMVFLTPHILRDDDAASQMTEEVKDALMLPPPPTVGERGTER